LRKSSVSSRRMAFTISATLDMAPPYQPAAR
jgi:hypothetical protein